MRPKRSLLALTPRALPARALPPCALRIALPLTALLLTSTARATPDEPLLSLEVGAHQAPVQLAAGLAAGRPLVVTGAADRSVRVWAADSGAALRALYPPRGAGDGGAIGSVALSPDGALIAAAGWAGARTLSVLDWDKGRVVRQLALDGDVAALAFSADGALLAAGLTSGGLRILAVSSGAEIGRAADCPGAIPAVDIARDGRIAATCTDRRVRLYDPAGRRLGESPPTPHAPHAVRFSPDGKRLAIGYADAPRVDVLSSRGFELLYRPDAAGIDSALRSGAPSIDGGDLRQVAWSPAGDTLYAAGAWRSAEGYLIRRWSAAGQGRPQDGGAAPQPITALSPMAGGVAYASGAGWGAWSNAAARLGPRSSGAAEHLRADVRLDATGSRLGFSLADGIAGMFALTERTVLLRSVLQPPPARADLRLGVSGTELSLSQRQDPPRWRVTAPAAIRAAALSADGRLVVAALADGTFRWRSALDGRELLAWYLHPDRRRWVAWTPSGYYDASVGGEDLLAWRFDRDAEHGADLFRIGRFRERYYRPDVLSRVLFSLDERRAVEELDAESGRKEPSLPLLRQLPPIVTILDPADGTVAREERVALRVAVRSPSGAPVTAVRVLTRGQHTTARDLSIETRAGRAGGPGVDEEERQLTVSIPPEDCLLMVLAETDHATSEPALVHLRWAGPRAPRPDPAPALYVLSVGVSSYRGPGMQLDYPAKDAREIAAALRQQQGRRYRKVEARVLSDAEASRAAILQGLRWLKDSVSSTDVALVFLAGHGVNDRASGVYLYLPHGAELDHDETMISGEELKRALGQIAGRVLLLLDTCHSGNLRGLWTARGAVDLTRLTNDLATLESGVVVFAASAGGQASKESARWGNGAFTKAVIEGLKGRADYTRSGQITVSMMEHYIFQRVMELTQEAQTPTSAKPGTVPDFVMATVPVRPPLHRRWWFWGAVGTAAAATVAGVGVGLSQALRPRDPATDAGTVMVNFPLRF